MKKNMYFDVLWFAPSESHMWPACTLGEMAEPSSSEGTGGVHLKGL